MNMVAEPISKIFETGGQIHNLDAGGKPSTWPNLDNQIINPRRKFWSLEKTIERKIVCTNEQNQKTIVRKMLREF